MKINWLNKNVWKQNLKSTFICFISCSIGMMLTTVFFMTISIAFQFVVSVLASFILSFTVLALWNITFKNIYYKEAIKSSYHTSFISIIIMMVISYLFMILLQPKFPSHQMSMSSNVSMNMNVLSAFPLMLLSMVVGLIVALPFNYYILHKTGRACHT